MDCKDYSTDKFQQAIEMCTEDMSEELVMYDDKSSGMSHGYESDMSSCDSSYMSTMSSDDDCDMTSDESDCECESDPESDSEYEDTMEYPPFFNEKLTRNDVLVISLKQAESKIDDLRKTNDQIDVIKKLSKLNMTKDNKPVIDSFDKFLDFEKDLVLTKARILKGSASINKMEDKMMGNLVDKNSKAPKKDVEMLKIGYGQLEDQMAKQDVAQKKMDSQKRLVVQKIGQGGNNIDMETLLQNGKQNLKRPSGKQYSCESGQLWDEILKMCVKSCGDDMVQKGDRCVAPIEPPYVTETKKNITKPISGIFGLDKKKPPPPPKRTRPPPPPPRRVLKIPGSVKASTPKRIEMRV